MPRIRLPIILLFALALLLGHPTAAQDPNPSISNGTCYYSAGNEANSRYIPCGNAALGHFTCCEGQDMCLSNEACYNGRWGVTYLAGCSDQSYSDPVCPDKGEWDAQEWVGLSYCNGTSNEWVRCNDTASDSSTVTSHEPCWCPSTSAIIAFTAPSVLDNVVSLPTQTGESLTCESGFVGCPGTAPSASTSSTSSSPSSAATSSSSKSSSTSRTNASAGSSLAAASTSSTQFSSPTTGVLPGSSSASLSSGAKAGIGIGAAAGVLIGLALLWRLATCVRRREKGNRMSAASQIRPRSHAFIMEKDPSDELDPRSPTWSGHKSELPADERASVLSPVPSQQAWTRPTSAEVEGTIPTYQSMGSLCSEAMGDGGPAYKPRRKAEVPGVGIQEVPVVMGSDSTTYQSGRTAGSGTYSYEMPAQVPGSTLPQ